MQRVIDSKALKLAAHAGLRNIESIEIEARAEKENSFVLSCCYSGYMDSFWHYIAHYYGEEEIT